MRCVRKRLLAALLTTSFATFVVASSDAIEPAWSRDFAVPIEWQRVTAFGHLLVETRDGLFAVEPETGEIRWKRLELGGLPAAGFREIAGSPLALLTSAAPSSRTMIVNVFNGALVFDSRAENLTSIASANGRPFQ